MPLSPVMKTPLPLLLTALALTACQTSSPVQQPSAPAAVKKPSTPVKAVPAGKMTRISLEQFFPLQQERKALIIDARPGFVHAITHIPGSVSWPRRAFEEKMAENRPLLVEAKKNHLPIIVYCTDLECPDAANVAGKITALGYDASVLEGGFATWKEAGLDTE
jgi:rhodanese-related sulfurtransferase